MVKQSLQNKLYMCIIAKYNKTVTLFICINYKKIIKKLLTVYFVNVIIYPVKDF
jgi:hypothetical protein